MVGKTGRLRSGAFAGLAAKVKLVGSGGRKLRVAIELFGRTTDVDIGAGNFEP